MSNTLDRVRKGDTSVTSPEKRVVRDFYLSYRFSQGDGNVHSLLMAQLSLFYSEHLPFDEMRWLFDNRKHMQERLGKLGPPRQHVSTKDTFNPSRSVVSRREKASNTYFNDGRKFLSLLHGRVIDGKHSLSTIALGMAARDTEYLTIKHRGHREGEDPFKSYFREHVVLSEPSSEAFNDIFSRALEDVRDNGTLESDTVTALATIWESHHPGTTFFPEGFIE